MATIEEIANLAGVSTATVSRVLNQSGYVSEELIKRVLDVVQKLNYFPNGIARSLSTGSTNAVGILLPDISNTFFAMIAKGCEEYLWKEGYSLILCDSNEDCEQQERHIITLLSRRIDGLIITPTSGAAEVCSRLLKTDISCVFVDRFLKDIDIDYIGSDNFNGAYDAISYTLLKGHRNIGILLADPLISTSQERLEGYQKAILDAGLNVNESFIKWGCFDIGKSFAEAVSLLKENHEITAIFCSNSLATIGTLKALKSLHLEYPNDISIIGFDDFPLSELLDRPITTVSQDAYQLGHKAGEILLKIIREGKSSSTIREIIPCKFIESLSVSNFNS
jgi:DNA-binding LacI/PurR family transcriptional regulator